MIQNTCESAVPIVEFQQFLKTQRGYVAERLKSAKTSAERGRFLGALKMLDLVERGMSHFSRIGPGEINTRKFFLAPSQNGFWRGMPSKVPSKFLTGKVNWEKILKFHVSHE